MKDWSLIKTLGVIAVGALMPVAATAQDIHFSQFYETSILRNPAMTGVFTSDYKVGANYRTQWNSISKPFQTGMVSAETRFAVGNSSDNLSVGLLAYYDKAGSIDMKTISVYPAINYNKSLEDDHSSFLSVGFTGGFIQRSVDPSKMTTNSQYDNNKYDPARGTGEQLASPNINNWDLGAGISFSSSTGTDALHTVTYYVGVSGYHFTQPKNSFLNNSAINLAMKFNGTAGMSMALNENYNVQFHANYMQQGSYSEVIGGGLLGWSKAGVSEEGAFGIFGGVFYRLKDAVIPTVKIKYKDYTFSMCYDVNVSKLMAASNLRGGYEITAFKTGMFKSERSHKAKTICPHSFW